MKKIVIVGRGEMTEKQKELLKKFAGEVVVKKQIEQLATSPQEAGEQLGDVDVVFCFVSHPAVLATLNTLRRFKNFDVVVVETEAVSKERANEADIVNKKILPDGSVSERYLISRRLLVNPVIKIEYESVVE